MDLVAFDGRGRATLGALRCAIKLEDIEAIEGLALWWRAITEGDFIADVIDLVKELGRRRLFAQATELAWSEVHRYRSARALYLHARCLEVSGDAGPTAAAYAEAAARAKKEGHLDIATTASVRRVAVLAAAPETLPLALTEASELATERLDDDVKLALCTVLLLSPSRFVRASALASLEELAAALGPRSGDAVRLAAHHVDALGYALSPLEAERAATVLRHWPNEEARAAAALRLAALQKVATAKEGARDEALVAAAEADPETSEHLVRARAALAGAARGPSLPLSAQAATVLRAAALGLDAIVAMRDGHESDAARALGDASKLAHELRPAPPPLWTAAHQALLFASATVRAEGVRLAEALLQTGTGAPPRGYVAFAAALRGARRADLALRALRAAYALRETNATDALVTTLTTEAWSAAERAAILRRESKPLVDVRASRHHALVLLREAKALSSR
jgi:hypothetical protein